MIHKSKAIAEHGHCIGVDCAYVYRYEDGTIQYLSKDGTYWQDHSRGTEVSDREADRLAYACYVDDGDLPEVRRLDIGFHVISYTCDGITFGKQAIPIQTLKYTLGQLVPFVYKSDGERGIEIRPELLMGVSGVLTEPKELSRTIRTWELVNQKKECTYCGRYLDETETLCKACNRTQEA